MGKVRSNTSGRDVAVFDGRVVVPTGDKQVSPAELTAQIKSIASLPYMGKDTAKIGMTLAEAAIYEMWLQASEGDIDAADKVLNRILGKPMQMTMQATGTLKEFLDGIARSDGAAPEDIDPFSE